MYKIAGNLADLVEADYRVRTQIKDSIEKTYIMNRNQPFAANIAFQIAFCYHIGSGVKSNANKCQIWLQKSNKNYHDLKSKKKKYGLQFGKVGECASLMDLLGST